jgi:hypothetical protein
MLSIFISVPLSVLQRFQQERTAAALPKPAPPEPESVVTPDDVELSKKLLAAANGNVIEGPGIEDLAPIKAMIASGVDLDDVLYALRGRVDRRAYPGMVWGCNVGDEADQHLGRRGRPCSLFPVQRLFWRRNARRVIFSNSYGARLVRKPRCIEPRNSRIIF